MASIASRNVAADQPNTEGLTSWWSKFKSKPTRKEPEAPRSIFNVPLSESITYANVAISLYNDDGQTFIYGYIPIVVAKCGLFLKDNATETEGIFRLSGSAKRIKDLQAIFDQPPKYGKGLDWAGFTVHDAANILRRYLNHLPDPIIPYDWYDAFREPLKESWSTDRVIRRMQELVASLPPLNRQLLLYILDLLAVFASKCDINRMTSENLSAIFQPGLITHPRDDMAPQEYKLSQEVLVFLIDHQSHFLLDSLCSPTKEQAQLPTDQRKTSVSRRKTLQVPKRSPSVKQTESPSSARIRTVQASSPRSTPTGTASNLSRSNTVPTKRTPPGRPEDVTAAPRFVSNPVVSRVPPPGQSIRTDSATGMDNERKISGHVNQAIADQQLLESSRSTPRREVNRNRSSTPPRDDSSPSQPIQSRSGSAEVYSPPSSRLNIRSNGANSRRNSQNSSVIGAESEFSIISGRKAVPPESGHVTLNTPSHSDQRPLSISAATSLGDKASQNKQLRTTSSSPSKFSNLFKKKPRNQSISSTSEAGGRRDLDK